MSVSPGSSAAHERGDSHFGRIFHEQVHVVVFTVHLHKRSVRVGGDVGEDGVQDVDSPSVEYTAILFLRRPNSDEC